MEKLDYAILFATKAHDGQRRKTDNYEGRLEDFILDMSSDLTGKIAKQLEVKKEEQVKSCISHEDNGEER